MVIVVDIVIAITDKCETIIRTLQHSTLGSRGNCFCIDEAIYKHNSGVMTAGENRAWRWRVRGSYKEAMSGELAPVK